MRADRFPKLVLLSIVFAACNNGLDVPFDEVPSDAAAGVDAEPACATAKDEGACKALPNCEAAHCPSPSCDGTTQFVECVVRGMGPMVSCPAAPCPTPHSCAQTTDATMCDLRSDCYARYSGILSCQAPWCDNHFVTCEEGPAICTGAICNRSCPAPAPICPAGFVNGYPAGPASICCSDRCVAAPSSTSGKCAGGSR